MLQQAGDVTPKAFHLFIFLEGKIQNLWKDEVGKAATATQLLLCPFFLFRNFEKYFLLQYKLEPVLMKK